MPGPVQFAVEFTVDKAKDSLGALVDATKGAAASVAGILAPVSPTNLVTQIAQQGLGLNALGNNLVAGGVGALANSRFGGMVQMGMDFNAENAAMTETMGQMRAARMGGRPMTDAQVDDRYNSLLREFKAGQDEEMRFMRGKGAKIAENDIDKFVQNGSKALNQLTDYLSETSAAKYWAEKGFWGGVRDVLGNYLDPAGRAGQGR